MSKSLKLFKKITWVNTILFSSNAKMTGNNNRRRNEQKA
jgi:hypothetical protein